LSAIGLIVVLMNFTASAQVDDHIRQLEQAAAFIADNRTAEAERVLLVILKRTPNEPVALNLLGTIRAKQNRLPEAENLFLRSVKADGKYVGARLNLAHVYALRSQPLDTIRELREVLVLDPGNTQALDQLSRLLLARGDLAEGIKVLEQAELAQTLSAEQSVLLADAYLKNGNVDKAAERYQRVLDLQMDNTDAVLGLAQVAQLNRNRETALTYLARARKMVATSSDTLYRFAQVAFTAGLYEEANGTVQAAIKLNPKEPSYFLLLGTTWITKPDLVAAEAAFRRALELAPDNPKTQMNLGYALLEQKNYREARVWLEKSLQGDSSVPKTYFYLGQIAQEQNEDVKAVELFKKTLALAPSYSFAHAGLGASYLRLKNYVLAQQELETSIRLNPNDARAHYNLAVLFARLKNQQRAQEEMQIVETLKTKKPGQSN
jgi:tetratricopeptide (TPR) repeat protein